MYEYLAFAFAGIKSTRVTEVLNKCADEGWRLIGMTDHDSLLYLVLEREKPLTPEEQKFARELWEGRYCNEPLNNA